VLPSVDDLQIPIFHCNNWFILPVHKVPDLDETNQSIDQIFLAGLCSGTTARSTGDSQVMSSK